MTVEQFSNESWMKKVLDNKTTKWSRSGHEYGRRLPPVEGWRPLPVKPPPQSESIPEQWVTTSSDYGHGWYLNHQSTFAKYTTKQKREPEECRRRTVLPTVKLVPIKVQQEELLHPTVMVTEELEFSRRKPRMKKRKGLLFNRGPMNFSFHTPWNVSMKQ